MITIDKNHNIPVFSPVCSYCTHLYKIRVPRDRKCKAFPKEIPLEIWIGKNLHTKKFPGQKGDFVFKPSLIKTSNTKR